MLQPENFRPIALTICMGCCFTRSLLNAWKHTLLPMKLLTPQRKKALSVGLMVPWSTILLLIPY